MVKNNDEAFGSKNPDLRQRAEQKVREDKKNPDFRALSSFSPSQAAEIYQELRVHQFELELQNEELRRTQSELEAARERYFDLYDTSPVGYFSVSMEGKILEANSMAANLLGIDRYTLIGRQLMSFVLPQDLYAHQSCWKQLFETGSPQTWQLRVRKRTGALLWGRFQAIRIESRKGPPVCRLVLSDITEQVQAEQTAEEIERRLRLVLQSSQTGVWDLEIESLSVYHSLEYDQIFGYATARPEWDYEIFRKHVVPEDRAEVEKQYQHALTSRDPWSFEFRIRRADGALRWILAVGRYRIDARDGKPHVGGIIQDITELKLAQASLQESEERFRVFMKHLPGLAYIKDIEGNYLFQSGAACSKIEAFANEQTARQAHEEDRQVLETNSPITRLFALETPGGVEHWLLTRFPIPISSGSRKILGAIGVEITDRIRTQEQLEAALQEETVLKREIHHRVKNSLQVVISLLYIQSLHTADPTLREILRECQSRTHAIALIYTLLSSENMAQIAFGQYAKQLATDLRIAYQGKLARVDIQVRSENIFIDVDTALPLGLILTELISNSFKYAFPDNREGLIEIQLKAIDGGLMELLVADNGVGPPEAIKLESAKTVGLSLVGDLTRQLGGKITFQAHPGLEARIVWPKRKRRVV